MLSEKEKTLLAIFSQQLQITNVRFPIALGVIGDETKRITEVGYNISLLLDLLFSQLKLGNVGIVDLQQSLSQTSGATLSSTIRNYIPKGEVGGIKKILSKKKDSENFSDQIKDSFWKDGYSQLHYYLNADNSRLNKFIDGDIDNFNPFEDLIKDILLYDVDFLTVLIPPFNYDNPRNAEKLKWCMENFNILLYVDNDRFPHSEMNIALEELSPEMRTSLKSKTLRVPYNITVKSRQENVISEHPSIKLVHRIIPDNKGKILELRGKTGELFPILFDEEIIVPDYEKQLIKICNAIFALSQLHEKELL